MTLLKRLSDDKTVAMNENENENTETTRTVCKPRPNLTNETMFHAVYVPQDKDSPVGEIGCVIILFEVLEYYSVTFLCIVLLKNFDHQILQSLLFLSCTQQKTFTSMKICPKLWK